MTQNETQGEWELLAPFWIRRCEDGEPNREGMLDHWMLEVLGTVTGLRIVDLGCGEGRFCRTLAHHKASYVLGVDLCEPLILEARKRRVSDAERYMVGNIEDLHSVEDDSFDIAISYVSLVDVTNLEVAISSSYRVLKPGGRFVVCNLAPMATSANCRITDPDGSRIAIRVDHYFDESTRVMHFRGHEITNFHRTLSTYVNAFLESGYVFKGLHEPRPSKEDLASYPELENELRAPSFVIYDLEKPTSKLDAGDG